MITDIVIEDYQAIKRADLALGQFTVVTGPTGSGKSAVIRAMKLVAFNARGTTYVRHGATTCRAVLGFAEETLAVAITRGGRGKDSYRIATAGPVVVELTKLAGAVPEEVSRLLKLSDLNFAGQFDRPYLLAETGSTVARVLGELTNVTLVFDAAREANRRRLEIARDLKAAEASVERLKDQALAYRGLKERRTAAFEAREHLDCMRQITQRVVRLSELASGCEHWRQVLSKAEASVIEVPSADTLDTMMARIARLRSLYAQHGEAVRAARTWEKTADAEARGESAAHEALHEALVAAGVCPTCGQRVD